MTSKAINTQPFINWGKKYPPFVRAFTEFFIHSTDMISQVLIACGSGVKDKDNRVRTLQDVFKIPERKEWLKLYYRRHAVYASALRLVADSEDNNSADDGDMDILGVYSFFRHTFTRMRLQPEKCKQELTELMTERPEEYKEFMESLKPFPTFEFTEEDMKDDANEDFSEHEVSILSDMKTLFMFRVVMPCFAYFNTTPSHLIHKARRGDIEALCCLLKLDKSVIYDKKISKYLYEMQYTQPNLFKNRITRALAAPFPRVNRKKLKNNIAGFIWNLFGGFFNLSTMDIHSGFDACAQATSGNLVDPDIQTDEEAHRRVLRRQSQKWEENYKSLKGELHATGDQ